MINLAKCRFCNTKLKNTFVDLGMSPLANSYLKKEQLNKKENFYPLNAYVCSNCYLVQLEEFESPKEIFNEYAYFSSYSDSWLRHAKIYSEKVIERFNINSKSKVIEIASNDGYLLQYFKKENIPVLGIEPAKNVALEAEK
ncbi:SAM-dependent methyltransferase, partial [Clostridium botulinum]|nr:SAM-dependent methyltransferase [Clostridium botulinum]